MKFSLLSMVGVGDGAIEGTGSETLLVRGVNAIEAARIKVSSRSLAALHRHTRSTVDTFAAIAVPVTALLLVVEGAVVEGAGYRTDSILRIRSGLTFGVDTSKVCRSIRGAVGDRITTVTCAMALRIFGASYAYGRGPGSSLTVNRISNSVLIAAVERDDSTQISALDALGVRDIVESTLEQSDAYTGTVCVHVLYSVYRVYRVYSVYSVYRVYRVYSVYSVYRVYRVYYQEKRRLAAAPVTSC